MFAKFFKIQLDSLVDFERCCKTRIYLQRSVPIPKHFLKLAASASQPASQPVRVNPEYFQISLSFNFQISNFKSPNFPTTTQFSIEPRPVRHC